MEHFFSTILASIFHLASLALPGRVDPGAGHPAPCHPRHLRLPGSFPRGAAQAAPAAGGLSRQRQPGVSGGLSGVRKVALAAAWFFLDHGAMVACFGGHVWRNWSQNDAMIQFGSACIGKTSSQILSLFAPLKLDDDCWAI